MAMYLTTETSDMRNLSKEVGGKCAQLARVSLVGLEVPDWYCVTKTSFHAFLQYNNIVSSSLEELTEQRLEKFRQTILQGAFPEVLQEEIVSASHALLSRAPTSAVVVRSSATAEDSVGAAHAGLFDTFLGIRSVDIILEKIKACWASLWSYRATKYRAHLMESDENAMAVIVQVFIPAEVSGTIFTANPVSRNLEEMIIESSWGLGETIVAGRVVPDHFLVRIEGNGDRILVDHKLGSKRRHSFWDHNSHSIEELDTPKKLQNQLSLDKTRLETLVRIGMRLQSAFSIPQDIEWSIHGSQVYVLQSRPITRL